MRLIGTVSETKTENGMYLLTVKKLPVPLRGLHDRFAGKRVLVVGAPKWSRMFGSYFGVIDCSVSDEPDHNDVEVEGMIVHIFPERKNGRNRRSACLMLQQGLSSTSTVLITALSSNVDVLQPDNLSIGTRIRVGGYISYHGKGLHVLYMKTLYKEESKHAG